MATKTINTIKTPNGILIEIVNDKDFNEHCLSMFNYLYTPVSGLIFQNNNGLIFNISKLLNGVYFFNGDVFRVFSIYDEYDKKWVIAIVYNAQEFRHSYGILSLLHEVGHCLLNQDNGFRLVKKISYIINQRKSLSDREFFKKVSKYDRALIVRNERNAWAWSIRILRNLSHRSAYDINGIKKYIYNINRLRSYEAGMGISVAALRAIRNNKNTALP